MLLELYSLVSVQRSDGVVTADTSAHQELTLMQLASLVGLLGLLWSPLLMCVFFWGVGSTGEGLTEGDQGDTSPFQETPVCI
jgi:hypothetical protein